jgi:hypothetical protein
MSTHENHKLEVHLKNYKKCIRFCLPKATFGAYSHGDDKKRYLF